MMSPTYPHLVDGMNEEQHLEFIWMFSSVRKQINSGETIAS